jgi:flavin-dependent dehydrogenase
VSIVGGGPAGSFAALHLLQLSRQHNLQLKVRIFEPRDFTRPGPSGCNRCAGVLSSRLWGNLFELGLSLPDQVLQAELKHYTLHLDGETLHLDRPDPARRIFSVYRGGGPRMLEGPPQAGFDHFLLQQAIQHGAVHIPSRVRQVTWENGPVAHARQESYPSDLLVLAIGVNSKTPLEESFHYRPPRTEIMAQDEIYRPEGWEPDEVNAYFQQPRGLSFGAIIPKGRFVNISLLGRGFTRDTVDEFIAAQNLTDVLQYGPESSLCGCNPRIAVGPARHYYGDRWVAVGDAAVTRLYKDGLGSAYETTRSAMSTAVEFGVSRTAFSHHYAPICRSIARDNQYGFWLFRLWNLVLNTPSVLNAWKRSIQREESLPVSQRRHMRVLWGMLTGDEPYRRLFLAGVNPIALLHIGSRIRPGWGGG